MTQIHRIRRNFIARAALLLLSGTMLFACTTPAADDDDDTDEASSGEQSGSVCASACAEVYQCGFCVAVDGDCVSQTECVTGCHENPSFGELASCVDSAPTCDDVASCFESGGGESDTCPWTNDGECDEPEGLGVCAEGTDVNDCRGGSGGCPWANDGECDEPEGTGLCAEGTDGSDCW